jgi:hypothetical protein
MADEPVSTSSNVTKASGCSPIMFLVILLILGSIVFGGNAALGFYASECVDMDLFECAKQITEEEEVAGVAATGPYSYKDYSITLTANIPLEGGAVTGTISGDCSGKVTGSFDGTNGGTISGTLAGACNPFFVNIPASATFSGVVNKDSKSVPISFQGSGGGFSHEGSMTLTY